MPNRPKAFMSNTTPVMQHEFSYKSIAKTENSNNQKPSKISLCAVACDDFSNWIHLLTRWLYDICFKQIKQFHHKSHTGFVVMHHIFRIQSSQNGQNLQAFIIASFVLTNYKDNWSSFCVATCKPMSYQVLMLWSSESLFQYLHGPLPVCWQRQVKL